MVLETKLRSVRGAVGNSRAPFAIEFTVDRRRIGLFAELNWVLYCLSYARAVGATARVRISSDTYLGDNADDTGWLGQYFDTTWMEERGSARRLVRVRIDKLEQLPFYSERVGRLSLWEAHDLAEKYLRPLPHITRAVDRLVDSHLGPRFIGIHWRGTDKVSEAPPVTADQVAATLVRVCSSLPCPPDWFYFATDDQRVVSELESALASVLPNIPMKQRGDIERSTDGTALHLRANTSAEQRKKMGEDAVIDCLTLSRSMALVRTASFLSGWCSIFDPTLPVYMLNAPYEQSLWFPDREVKLASEYFWKRLPS